jgi:hypothetical protein
LAGDVRLAQEVVSLAQSSGRFAGLFFMIHCVYGKLGSGKGLYVMKRIEEELVYGWRDIVTNVPLRFAPWVNGKGVPQMGLIAYLNRQYGDTFDASNRIKVIPADAPVEEQQMMFLWRRRREWADGEDPWVKLELTRRAEAVSFSTEGAKGCSPLLIVNDEAWAHFPVKAFGQASGATVVPVIEFYGRQQRKFQDEWYLATQHHDDLHHVFERITQDHTVCRNHGMEKIGMFRQPKKFCTKLFYTMPGKSAKCFHESYFSLPDDGLAQCYDTSAGVGMTGGFAADKVRSTGLHWGWGIAALLVGMALLAMLPWFMGHSAGNWLTKLMNPHGKNPYAWAGISNPVPGSASPPPVQQVSTSVAPIRVSGQVPDSSVTLTGLAVFGGEARVMLSDGSVLLSGDKRLGTIEVKRGIAVVDGKPLYLGAKSRQP